MKKIKIFASSLLVAVMVLAPCAVVIKTAKAELAQTPAVTTVVGDVNTLKATAGDSSVSLEWEAAKGNVAGYKVYYGTVSVKNDNEAKYTQSLDAGNTLKYVVVNLENGKTYYFVVTAYDAKGVESDFYSPEVFSVPMSNLSAALVSMPKDEGNKAVAPGTQDDSNVIKIEKVEAVDAVTVKVGLSVAVVLSENAQDLFTIQDNKTLDLLKVSKAEIDTGDMTKKTVLLTTDIQIPETEYLLTLGGDLKGEKEEVVVSGKSDALLFKGTDKEHVEKLVATTDSALDPAAETGKLPADPAVTDVKQADVVADKPAAEVLPSAPEVGTTEVKSVKAVDEKTIKIVFSKKIALSVDPVTNFAIVQKENPEKTLEITGVKLEEGDTTVTLTIKESDNEKAHTLLVKGVLDVDGKLVDETKNTKEFTPIYKDITPPEDATNFNGENVEYKAKLTWTASLNIAGDFKEYVLYKSNDGGKNYSVFKKLDLKTVTFEVAKLSPGKEYNFKLTAKDKKGNESVGVLTKVLIPELPATGPAGVYALMIAALGFGVMNYGRKLANDKV
ncbi:MAG: fibronectin type III domain-containing protein [Candidatus Gracilibacteria bacterium]